MTQTVGGKKKPVFPGKYKRAAYTKTTRLTLFAKLWLFFSFLRGPENTEPSHLLMAKINLLIRQPAFLCMKTALKRSWVCPRSPHPLSHCHDFYAVNDLLLSLFLFINQCCSARNRGQSLAHSKITLPIKRAPTSFDFLSYDDVACYSFLNCSN